MKNIVWHMQAGELIGLTIEVRESMNKQLIGICGTIIDETKNTLKVQTNDTIKTIIKDQCIFIITSTNEQTVIDGKQLVARPEERTKKWLKQKKPKTSE